MMKSTINIFILAFLFISSSVVNAGDRAVHLNEKENYYILGDKIEILGDPKNSITINDLLDKKFDGKFHESESLIPNFGFTNSFYWIRFNIVSDFYNDQDTFDFILELANPHFDNAEFFIFDSDGGLSHLKTGDSLPFYTRSINHRNILFKVKTYKGLKQTVFINLRTKDSFQLPLFLMTLNRFIVNEQRNLIFYGIFYGILILMSIGSFLIYLIEFSRQYLSYSFFVITLLAWQTIFEGFGFQLLWPSQPWVNQYAVPVLLNMTTIGTLIFSKYFLSPKKAKNRFNKFLTFLIIADVLSCFIFLIINYSLSIRIATFNAAVTAIILLMIGLYKSFRGSRSARYFSLAMSLYLLGTIVFVVTRSGVLPLIWVTERAQQFGILIQSSILFIALTERFAELTRMKSEAEETAQREKEKYKIIVEESDDIIFTMDNVWNILSANKAMKRHLKVSPSEIEKVNLLDLIYEEDKTERFESIQIIHEKLERFLREKNPINFKAILKSSFIGEPVDFNIYLEYINIHGRSEVLGRAINIVEDNLLKYFINEKQKFSIENYLITADEITRRITRNLSRYIDVRHINAIRIALREIIINAIEHGNLKITYDEKSQALESGNYFSIIKKRRNDKSNLGKRVAIDYSLDQDKVKYRITDEGHGFDYKKFIKQKSEQANIDELAHGRGLSMAMNVFDEITFNRRGNQVLLVKYFGQEPENKAVIS